MNIPLSQPDIGKEEIKYVMKVLKTPFLSIGPMVKEFEMLFADYIGAKYAVAVSNGTAGLHLCIKSNDIGYGDEVITTPFSFISSANCCIFENAKPVFVDIDPKTLNIDHEKIEDAITSNTKAILPVHVFGHPCNMDEITGIARKYNLSVIEDSCEAIGAEYEGKKVGNLGTCGVFAFYPNKQMTTGEGGMIVTNDKNIAELCKSLRNQGRALDKQWLSHERLGYNYRVSEMNCALGIAQLKRIEEILNKREKVASAYNRKLKEIKKIKLPFVSDNIKVSRFVYVIQLKDCNKKYRDKVMEELEKCGVSCSNYFQPIHLQPFYRKMFGYKPGDYSISESIADTTIALPFNNKLKMKEIDYIVKCLTRILQ